MLLTSFQQCCQCWSREDEGSLIFLEHTSMLDIVSHNLKNPLVTICSTVQVQKLNKHDPHFARSKGK